jgi:hypothetical protein
MMALASNRHFEFVNTGQRGLERNTVIDSEDDTLRIVVHIIRGTSCVCGLAVVLDITR